MRFYRPKRLSFLLFLVSVLALPLLITTAAPVWAGPRSRPSARVSKRKLAKEKAALRASFYRDSGIDNLAPIIRDVLLLELGRQIEAHLDATLHLRGEEVLYLGDETDIESFQRTDELLKQQINRRASELRGVYNSLNYTSEGSRIAATNFADSFILSYKKFEQLNEQLVTNPHLTPEEDANLHVELSSASKDAVRDVQKAIMLSYRAGEFKAEYSGKGLGKTGQILSIGGIGAGLTALGPIAGGGAPLILFEAPVAVGVAAGIACFGLRYLKKRLQSRSENKGVWETFINRLSLYSSTLTSEHKTPAALLESCQSLLISD